MQTAGYGTAERIIVTSRQPGSGPQLARPGAARWSWAGYCLRASNSWPHDAAQRAAARAAHPLYTLIPVQLYTAPRVLKQLGPVLLSSHILSVISTNKPRQENQVSACAPKNHDQGRVGTGGRSMQAWHAMHFLYIFIRWRVQLIYVTVARRSLISIIYAKYSTYYQFKER